MGEDKAWLELGGRPLILHSIDVLRSLTADVSIIATGERYQSLGFPVYHDSNLDVGPLEAIRIAAANASSEWAIVLACDLPLVKPSLFELLLSLREGYDVVVPTGHDGHLETLCALYSRKILTPVTELILGGGRMVRLLFESVRTRTVSFEELKDLEESSLYFENINTRLDYERVRNITSDIGTREKGPAK